MGEGRDLVFRSLKTSQSDPTAEPGLRNWFRPVCDLSWCLSSLIRICLNQHSSSSPPSGPQRRPPSNPAGVYCVTPLSHPAGRDSVLCFEFPPPGAACSLSSRYSCALSLRARRTSLVPLPETDGSDRPGGVHCWLSILSSPHLQSQSTSFLFCEAAPSLQEVGGSPHFLCRADLQVSPTRRLSRTSSLVCAKAEVSGYHLTFTNPGETVS